MIKALICQSFKKKKNFKSQQKINKIQKKKKNKKKINSIIKIAKLIIIKQKQNKMKFLKNK